MGQRTHRPVGLDAAVRGAWRKGLSASERDYLPLTSEVLTAHLSGEIEIGLYAMLDGDRCRWLAADFDGPAAMLDALAYLKAARAGDAPAALEVSRSGVGAHAVLHLPGSGGYGAAGRHRAAAGGDRAAGSDGVGLGNRDRGVDLGFSAGPASHS